MNEDVQTETNENEGQAQQPNATQQDAGGTGSQEVRITRADLDAAISDAASAAASGVSSQVSGGFAALDASLGDVSKTLTEVGTVTLVPEQYQTLTKLGATELRTDIVVCGLLALLLGAVIGVGITLHWRAGRG